MSNGYTRRRFLTGLPFAALAIARQPPKKPKEIPRVGEFVRYLDPLTENTLVRLTSLSSTNRVPPPQNSFISTRNRFLVFSSDRVGNGSSPHLLDLRSGVVRQLAQTTALDPLSLSLDESERSLFFLDGGVLKQVQISNRRVNTLVEDVSAFTGKSESDLLILRQNRLGRLRGEALATDVSGPCLLSPNGAFCLFSRTDGTSCEFWSLPLHQSGNPKRLAAGRIRCPFWSPDSQGILFLRDVEANGTTLSEIHCAAADGVNEEQVTRTSQFAAFAPNGNASVFVGASRSKAQPTINLLLRSSKRELTLCEHHATRAESVAPVFAPDSRRVYFQSDREGKPAIYSMNVELLIEPTG